MNAVYFDLDGTLADTRAGLVAAVNSTRAGLGLAVLAPDAVLAHVGNGARYLFEQSIPEIAGRHDSAWPSFRENYRAHQLDGVELYPGVRRTLEELHDRGWLLGICTNKPGDATRAVLDRLGVLRFFGSAIVADGDCAEMKPSALPIREAAARMRGHRVSAHDWMVGDNWTDMAAGANAGVKTAFCSFGFGRLNDARATVKINRMDEMLRYCKNEE